METAAESSEMRTLATKLFKAETPQVWATESQGLQHFEQCKAVQFWFPYEGTNKTAYKYMPKPKHADADRTCPGCAFDLWVRCCRKATATLSGEPDTA